MRVLSCTANHLKELSSTCLSCKLCDASFVHDLQGFHEVPLKQEKQTAGSVLVSLLEVLLMDAQTFEVKQPS